MPSQADAIPGHACTITALDDRSHCMQARCAGVHNMLQESVMHLLLPTVDYICSWL